MFMDKMDFSLHNVETGAEFGITVHGMRLKDKASLDEWLRVQYMAACYANGISVSEAEAQVEGLDCIGNQWFMNADKMAARITWELGRVRLSFDEFLNSYFDIDARKINEGGKEVERLTGNLDTAKRALEWACRNPTETVAASTPTTEPSPSTTDPDGN